MKKKFIIIVLGIMLLTGAKSVFAVNKEQNEVTQENNTYLSTLYLGEEGLIPFFSKYITNYALTVPESVNSLAVTAKSEVPNADVKITGNDNLKVGDNLVTVTVTSADGKNKMEYHIIVTRTDNPEKSNSYLVELVVDNYPLSPAFQSERLQYNIGEIGKDVNKLDIIAIPQNNGASIKILDNSSLKEGENKVKVIVTSPDQSTQKEYVIQYDKTSQSVESKPLISEGGDNAGIQTPGDTSIPSSVKNILGNKYIIISGVSVIVLILGSIVFFATRKNRKK